MPLLNIFFHCCLLSSIPKQKRNFNWVKSFICSYSTMYKITLHTYIPFRLSHSASFTQTLTQIHTHAHVKFTTKYFPRFVFKSTCDELDTSFLWSVCVCCRKHIYTHSHSHLHTLENLKLFFLLGLFLWLFVLIINVTMIECHSNARTYSISDARLFFALVILFLFWFLHFRRCYFQLDQRLNR